MNLLESIFVNPSSPNAFSPHLVYRPARVTNANRVFDLQNAEKGIVLRVGEQFILDLRQGIWSARVRDEMILASADGVKFQALAAGKTYVVVTGETSRENMNSLARRRKIFLEIRVTVLG